MTYEYLFLPISMLPHKELASIADFYVNDAFGTAHRAHASTEGITKFCSKAVSGFLMEKEVCTRVC